MGLAAQKIEVVGDGLSGCVARDLLAACLRPMDGSTGTRAISINGDWSRRSCGSLLLDEVYCATSQVPDLVRPAGCCRAECGLAD